MFLFILIVFLQTTPVENVLFAGKYSEKQTCLAAETFLKNKFPEIPADNVMCIQVVKPGMIKEANTND